MTADFLDYDIPVYVAAIGYLWVAVICILWATDLFVAAWMRGCPMPTRRILSRRAPVLFQRIFQRIFYGIYRFYCMSRRFETWLGLFLCFGDGILYGALGFLLIQDNSIPVWSFGILTLGILTGTGAYIAWSNEQPK